MFEGRLSSSLESSLKAGCLQPCLGSREKEKHSGSTAGALLFQPEGELFPQITGLRNCPLHTGAEEELLAPGHTGLDLLT